MSTAVIRIDKKDGDGYPTSLSFDSGGQSWKPETRVSGVSTPPDDAPDVLGAPLTFESAREVVLRRDQESPDFRVVGHHLHALLADGPVGAEWLRLRADAHARGESLRTLLDIRDPDLRRVPWELLADPDRALGMFADVDNPIARAHDFSGGMERPEEWWPLLRVMIIVALDDPGARAELAALHDGFAQVCGLVDLDVVRRPTEPELRKRYETLKPHIVHFIGHGKPGHLVFAAPPDKKDDWAWDAASIDATMRPRPRLVVLSACRSADLDEQDGVWDVADTLTKARVPAVVAMQGDVREDAAAAFSVELYRGLGSGVPVDAAVSAARYEMKAAGGGSWDRRDPYLPSLILAVPPEKVLPRLYQVEPGRRAMLRRTPGFETVHHFVDRGTQRRELWRRIVDVAEDGPPDGIAVVGQESVGKTEVAKWCVGACALRGHDAAYVDMDGRAPDSLGLLALIAEQLCEGSGNAPHVLDALDAYIEEVDRLHGHPPRSNDLGPAEGRYRREHQDGPREVIVGIYVAFRNALSRIAGEGHVLIALDHPPATQDGHWGRYVVPNLLGRLAEARTICIVAARDGALESILGPTLARSFVAVSVPRLQKSEFGELVGQFLRSNGYQRSDFGPWIPTFVELLADTMTPVYLKFAIHVALDKAWQVDPQP